jgi:hypothetical protein
MITSVTIASSISTRLRYLAPKIHALGVRPLFELLCELSRSSAALARFEAYASIDVDTLHTFSGSEMPPNLYRVK